MPKRINIVGETYGELTVIEMLYGYNNSNHTYCRCIGENDTEVVVRLDALRSGMTRTAKGSLTKGKMKDLTGKIFGQLVVIGITDERASNGSIMWKCKCSCGGEKICSATDLTRGRTTSCGCLTQKYYDSIAYNLTNQRFGMLTAIEYAGRKGTPGHYKRVWKCQCDCGGEILATVSDLIGGCTVSCGCLSTSRGEFFVSQVLKEYGVNFDAEHTFDGCRNILPLPFDFYLADYNAVIEYNGIQHYEVIEHFGGESTFQQVQKRDAIKKQYCKDNGIIFIEIPYTYTDIEIKNTLLNILSPATITA